MKEKDRKPNVVVLRVCKTPEYIQHSRWRPENQHHTEFEASLSDMKPYLKNKGAETHFTRLSHVCTPWPRNKD